MSTDKPTPANRKDRNPELDLDFFQSFFDDAPDMLAAIDPATDQIKACNRTLCTVLGLSREAIIGQNVRGLYHPDCLAEVDRLLTAFHRDGSAHSLTLELQSADNERIPVSLTISPYFDDAGKLIEGRAIWRDMTLQRKVERLQLELRLQATQKTQSLGLLAGGIAHDFNNLLVAIIGNAGLGMLETEAGTSLQRKLADIETAAQRAADLTQQLMAFAGAGGNAKTSFDLSQIVAEMGKLLDIAISRKAVLQYDLADEPVIAVGDITQVRQVIMNLLTNSSDAIGDRSGSITIRTGVQTLTAEHLQTTLLHEDLKAGRYSFLEVSDTGKGILSHHKDKIFDPFYTTKTKGHGLGLAAVLGIVRNHSGTLEVRSEPDAGTSIKVFLPTGTIKKEQPTKAVPARTGRNEHILVVDDESHVCDVAQQMLEHHGFQVSLCASGQEAIALYRASPKLYDAVLMDITMPVMDGIEAYKAIHAIDPTVRIVLMSGYSKQHATTALKGFGCTGFLQKPFRVQALIRAVVDALDDTPD